MEGVRPMPLGFPFKPKVKSERDVDIRRVFIYLFRSFNMFNLHASLDHYLHHFDSV